MHTEQAAHTICAMSASMCSFRKAARSSLLNAASLRLFLDTWLPMYFSEFTTDCERGSDLFSQGSVARGCVREYQLIARVYLITFLTCGCIVDHELVQQPDQVQFEELDRLQARDVVGVGGQSWNALYANSAKERKNNSEYINKHMV